MNKILQGGILIFFVSGLSLAGFLILNENHEILQTTTKPKYNVTKAEMILDDGLIKQYRQFVFDLNISQGSISIIGINHNLFKWELNGEINKTKSDKISFSLDYVGLGTRIKLNDNLNDYFIQILLSDGNIITWKFNTAIQMDFIP